LAANAVQLYANQYPGVIHPQAYQYQTRFRLDPFPIFTYEADGVEIEKTVFMPQGENATVVQYRIKTPSDSVWLEVRPLIPFRDYRGATQNRAVDATASLEPGLIGMTPYEGVLRMYLAHDADAVEKTG
jgi:predicted glycogen debranching enzyme